MIISKKSGKNITLLGYIPTHLPSNVHKNTDYDHIIECNGRDFSADQLHQSWIDLLRANIDPKTVKLLGMNGGKISAMEYRLAAALGATAGIIMNTGREADLLFSDGDWHGVPNLLFIPNEVASVSLFVSKEQFPIEEIKLEELSRLAHEKYLDQRIKTDKDDSLKYWEDLKDDLKDSNRQQVGYSVYNLKKAGFNVKKTANPNPEKIKLSTEEIELLAELEHGRWNAERLLSGWRYGPVKNSKLKISPYLVPWNELPDSIKKYDRDAVKEFPVLLAKGGMEVYRMKDQEKIFKQTWEMLTIKFEFSK